MTRGRNLTFLCFGTKINCPSSSIGNSCNIMLKCSSWNSPQFVFQFYLNKCFKCFWNSRAKKKYLTKYAVNESFYYYSWLCWSPSKNLPVTEEYLINTWQQSKISGYGPRNWWRNGRIIQLAHFAEVGLTLGKVHLRMTKDALLLYPTI